MEKNRLAAGRKDRAHRDVREAVGLAKEELQGPDLLKNKLLLFRNINGVNAWHVAAMRGSVEILRKLWYWHKQLQLEPEEIRNELLLLLL